MAQNDEFNQYSRNQNYSQRKATQTRILPKAQQARFTQRNQQVSAQRNQQVPAQNQPVGTFGRTRQMPKVSNPKPVYRGPAREAGYDDDYYEAVGESAYFNNAQPRQTYQPRFDEYAQTDEQQYAQYNQAYYQQESDAGSRFGAQNNASRSTRGGRGFGSLFSGRNKRERKPTKHGILSFFLWLIILATYVLLALRLIPLDYSTGRMVPELASFVPLAIFPALVCFVLALLWRRRVLSVVAGIALAASFIWHMGFFIPTAQVSDMADHTVEATATTEDNYARIMTLNTLNGAASAEEIVQLCKEKNVEVLCLQELPLDMVQELEDAGISEVLPYSVVSEGASAISNGGRNGIWTAAPISDVSRNLLPIDTSSMPAATITIGSQTVRVVSVHPNSPVRGAQDLWDEGLSVIGSLSGYSHSYLIMGDFNSTWDHARFRELLGDTFVDASEQSGEGFHMTYPSNSVIPSLIEIDHIVYSKDSGIVVSSLETVEISGTDHKALLATLEAE